MSIWFRCALKAAVGVGLILSKMNEESEAILRREDSRSAKARDKSTQKQKDSEKA